MLSSPLKPNTAESTPRRCVDRPASGLQPMSTQISLPMLRESVLKDSNEAIYLTESYSEILAPIDRTGNILRRLNETDRQTVMSRAAIKHLAKNEPVFTQGRAYDGIFIIESGKVRAYYTSPAGREYTLAFWTPGHFVGVPEVYGTGENLWSAVTAAPSNTLAVLRSKDIRWLIHHVPAFSIALQQHSRKTRCCGSMKSASRGE